MKTSELIDGKKINNEIKEIKSLFKMESTFEAGKRRFLALHALLYTSSMSKSTTPTFEDQLWDNLPNDMTRTAVNEKERTIIYGLWHATRIEDMTMNILIQRGQQIHNEKYRNAINAGIDHTGNSLSNKQILEMSARIDIPALSKYRLAVGKRSQSIIKSLQFADLKRKVQKSDIERIRSEGGVDDVPSANWLLDFWAKKNVEGILFMPASRHQIIHLRENFRAKIRGFIQNEISPK